MMTLMSTMYISIILMKNEKVAKFVIFCENKFAKARKMHKSFESKKFESKIF